MKAIGNTLLIKSFIVSMVLLLAACRNAQKIDPQTEFAADSSTQDDWHHSLVEALNLPSLKNGADSFELRLWSSLGPTDMKFVTILRYASNNWQLAETRYWSGFEDSAGSAIRIDSLVTYRKQSAITFNILVDSIKSLHLENILQQDNIPGFINRVSDGMSYTVELASKSSYRQLNFDNPHYYKDSHNVRFAGFLDLMQRQTEAFVHVLKR